LYDPFTTVMDARGKFVSRQPFPGARIPPDRINAVGAAVAGNHPQPNYTLFPNQLSQVNYLTSANARHPIFLWQSRVDHVLSSRHRLYFRYARNHSLVSDYDHLPVRGYSGYGTTQDGNTDDRLANQFAVEETATLRPTLVASFRLAFNRFDQKTRGDGDKQDPDALRLPEILKNNLYSGGGQRLGWPRFNVTDGPVPSVGPLFRRSVNNVGSFITSFTGYLGNHNLRWGWEYRLTRWFENQPGSAQNGLFEFAKALTRATDSSASEPVSGSGLASLLLGLPTSGSISRTPAMAVQSHYNAFYLVRMASVLLVATWLDGAAGADMPLAMNPEAWIRQVRVPGESRWVRLCACTGERLAAPNDVRCWVLGEPVAPARVGSMLLRSPSSKPRCEGGTVPKGFIRGRPACGWNSWSVAAH